MSRAGDIRLVRNGRHRVGARSTSVETKGEPFGVSVGRDVRVDGGARKKAPPCVTAKRTSPP